MKLHDVESPQGDPHVASIRDVLARLVNRRSPRSPGTFLLGIDGRSSSGKSTLASRIATVTPTTEVVHTDDIAWWHSRFGWDDLLIEYIIKPLRRGDSVAYRPPAWEERGRGGCIAVSAGAALVIIEGVGAGRSSITKHLDAVIWVQSDLEVTDRRNQARVKDGEIDPAGYEGWMSEESPFQAGQRTWQRADVVVCGSSQVPHDPEAEVVVLRP